MTLAKTYKRVIAMVIDFVLLILVFVPVTYLVKGTWIMFGTDHLWIITDPICILFLGVIVLYFVILERAFGQTLGKRIMRIKIVSLAGDGELTLNQVILRFLLLVLDSFLLGVVGYISIKTSARKQRIGDKLAKTIVMECG